MRWQKQLYAGPAVGVQCRAGIVHSKLYNDNIMMFIIDTLYNIKRRIYRFTVRIYLHSHQLSRIIISHEQRMPSPTTPLININIGYLTT